MKIIKNYVRARPALYDRARAMKRLVLRSRAQSFAVLDEFSRSHGGRVNFIQIGANDGLRNDPLRPLIVRDDWQGVFIEPLPTVFPLLQKNYAYLNKPELIFINAAITVDGRESLPFWTFSSEFLGTQSREDRLDYLRKASFDRDHVASFSPPGTNPDETIEKVSVPCLSLEQVIAVHLPSRPLHLLAIDAEGYESQLIPSIDFSVVKPEAVFFESEHLGRDPLPVFDYLRSFGYAIETIGPDSFCRSRRDT